MGSQSQCQILVWCSPRSHVGLILIWPVPTKFLDGPCLRLLAGYNKKLCLKLSRQWRYGCSRGQTPHASLWVYRKAMRSQTMPRKTEKWLDAKSMNLISWSNCILFGRSKCQSHFASSIYTGLTWLVDCNFYYSDFKDDLVCVRWDFSLFCNCFFLFLLILDDYWTLAIDVVRSSLTDKMVDLSLYQSTSISLRNFHLSSTAGARAPHSSLSNRPTIRVASFRVIRQYDPLQKSADPEALRFLFHSSTACEDLRLYVLVLYYCYNRNLHFSLVTCPLQ